jgi:hypothetical protein
LEFSAKLLSGPPCYLIGTAVELLIPIGQLSHSRIAEKPETFCAALMFCLFTEIYYSLDEVILESVIEWF